MIVSICGEVVQIHVVTFCYCNARILKFFEVLDTARSNKYMKMSTMGAQATSKPGTHPTGTNNGIKGKFQSIGNYFETKSGVARTFGIIGGVGLTVISIMSCFAIFNTFLAPLTYVMNVFFLIFGLVISIVSVFPESSVSERIYSQVSFMATLTGRAFFFLYLGALLFGSGFSGTSPSWTYLLIGSWMLLTSGVYFFLKCKGVGNSSIGTSETRSVATAV